MIKGLTYIPYTHNLLCMGYKPEKLMELIYKEDWCYDIKRRTQHYGYKYDYKLRSINEKQKAKAFPEWLKRLEGEVHHALIHTTGKNMTFDQCIINEYEEGQGIAPHIDCTPCFEDTIATLSLGAEYVMDFRNWKTKETQKLLLEVGSLLILSDEARYQWTHGLKPQKGKRVSITFRKVIIS